MEYAWLLCRERDKGGETRKQQLETEGYKEMGHKGGETWRGRAAGHRGIQGAGT